MEYDVVVAGGGPAGIGAAVAAGRNGARVLLIEASNSLGGMLTQGLVPMIRTAGDGGGIVREFRERLAALGGAVVDSGHAHINPCVARVAALEMALEAGAEVLFHALVEGVERDGPALLGVCAAGKGGPLRLPCRVVVDATGDGDVAALAGAPFDKGREGDGHLQAVSLNFLLAGVDTSRSPDRATFTRVFQEGLASGEIDLPPPHNAFWPGAPVPGYPLGIARFQFDLATDVDGSDAWSLARGEALCHQRVLRIWQFLRSHFDAYRDSVLLHVATRLGVRETRRIRGEATLTEADVLQGRKRPDGIARCSWYMDLHDGQEKHPMEAYRAARAPARGDFYEIPYGCLVPLSAENLLVAGRCISSTRPANGSLRLQAACMNTGQAAGTAAALCVKSGWAPRRLRGEELRAVLAEQGMEL